MFALFVYFGIGLTNGRRRVVCLYAFAVNQSGISLAYAFPAVIAVHSVKSAHNRCKLTYAYFLKLGV